MKINRLTKTVMLSVAPMGILAWGLTAHHQSKSKEVISCNNAAMNHVCVMKTIFGFEKHDDTNTFVMPAAVKESLLKGLGWIDKAQGNDGGWGAGTHFAQEVMDPHAVKSDPATTLLVCMS